MKNLLNPVYIMIVLILVIIILSITTCNGNRKANELSNLITALNDTMKTERNKNGEHIAKIAVLETQRVDDLLAIQSRDSTILWLQAEVKENKNRIKHGGSVTVFTTSTAVTASVKTDTIVKADTVKTDSGIFIFPEYPFSFDRYGGFLTGKGRVNRDSAHLDLEVTNKFAVILGFEKRKSPGKLLRKKIPFAEIKSENTVTETLSLRSYSVSLPKQKNFGISVGFGYGAYFDPSKLRFGHGIIASIGVAYQIIPIK